MLSVSWSPDSKRVAAASRDGSVCLWDAGTGEFCIRVFGYSAEAASEATCVVCSDDGKTVAAGSGYNACVWNAESGECLRKEEGWNVEEGRNVANTRRLLSFLLGIAGENHKEKRNVRCQNECVMYGPEDVLATLEDCDVV